MAFVKLPKGFKRVKTDELDVRMGSHRTKVGRTLYLAISEGTVETLGWQVNRSESGKHRRVVRIAINEGVGEDAGFLQITEDIDIGYTLGADHKNAGSYATNLVATRLQHYLLNDDDVHVEKVEFSLDEKEKAILIQCPDWLRYNPQSYQEPERPKLELTPPPKKEDKKSSRPTLSVVDSDTGDSARLNRKQRRLAAQVLTRAMR